MATCGELPSDHSHAVIQEVAKGERFKKFDLTVSAGSSKGDNYLGEIYRVVIRGTKESPVEESVSLIVKMAPPNPALRENLCVNKLYQHENVMYSKILPELDRLQRIVPNEDRFRAPKLYRGIVEDCKEMLIMEDLSARGYTMHERTRAFDFDHISLGIRKLAQFHACSVVLRARNPSTFDEFCAQGASVGNLGNAFAEFLTKNRSSVQKLIANKPYEAKMNKVLDELLMDIATVQLNPESSAPYNVLCHGDCWSNNLLFKYKDNKVEDMQMLDWQLFKKASPVTDLSYMIFTGTDRQLRAKHYREMLDLYYSTLAKNVNRMGVEINLFYPEKVYREHLKKYMKYGLLMCFSILPLTLTDATQAPDVADLVKKDDTDGPAYDVIFSDICSERMTGVIEDCIAYGII